MSNLTELYQDLILDHSRHPKNYGPLSQATHTAEGDNPICGDQLTVFLYVKNNIVENIRFEGAGCAISIASASLMTEHIMGKSIQDAKLIFTRFHQLMTEEDIPEDMNLGKLSVFENVKNYPMRIKCATLPWHAMNAALEHNIDKITTEEDHE